MTFLIGMCCLGLAVVGCYIAMLRTWSMRSSLIAQLAAFALFVFGTYSTQLAPYVLSIGVLALVLSIVKGVSDQISKTLRAIGYLSIPAAALVVVIGLFQSPNKDETEKEDRKDWDTPVVVEKTPLELLALEWSTYDRNCHWPVAKLMLDLSDIAYQAPVDAKENIRKLGFDSESINAGAMQGYVIDAGDDSIITIRGTENHEYDILQDLRFLRSKSVQGSMHGGFVSGYDPMHDQVLKLLERYETKRVWITGHSLGGGLAVVCANRLLRNDRFPIAGVMTFGQPKVVLDDMAKSLGPMLDGKYVFFVNDMDPVTRLVSPYEHFGHMVRWNGDDIERSKRQLMFTGNPNEQKTSLPELEAGYVEEMGDEELDQLISQLEDSDKPKYDDKGNLVVQGFYPSANDHRLASYQSMLEKLRTHKDNRK